MGKDRRKEKSDPGYAADGRSKLVDAILETVNDAVLFINKDKIVDCNSKAVELFGASSVEELVGLSPSQISPEYQPDGSDSKIKRETIVAGIQRGEKERFYWTHARLGGETFDTDVSLSSLNPDGDTLVAVVRDISEIQQEEESGRERGAHYRTLFEVANDFVFLHELDTPETPGYFLEVNSLTCQQLGYSMEEFRQLRPTEIISDLGQKTVAEEAENLIGDEQLISQKHLVTKTGNLVPVEIRARMFEHCGQKLVLAIGRDITKRQRAEERLKGSERQYRSLVENAGQPVFEVGLEGEFLFMNTCAATMVGLEPHQVAGKTMWDLFPEEIANRQMSNIRRVFRAGKGLVFEEETPLRGQSFWFETRLWPITDVSGKVTSVQAISFDISDRKRAEVELRKSELQFRALFEQAAVGMARLALDGSWLQINQRLCDITGFSESELLKRTFQELTHPDDLEADLEYANRMLAGEIDTYSMERRYFHKRGHVVWVSLTVSLVRNEHGQPVFFVAVVADISDRKQAEAELHATEARFSTIFRSNPMLVSLTRISDGTIIEVNPAWLRTTGYTYDEVIDRTTLELNLYTDPDQRATMLGELQKHGRVSNQEVSLRNKSGEVAIFLLSAETIELTNQQVVLSMAMDITERKQSEEALKSVTSFLDTVIDESPFAMWIAGPNGTIIKTNQSLRETLGLTDEQIIGNYNVLADANLEKQGLMPRVKRVFKNHEPVRFSLHWIATDAGDIHLTGANDLYIDASLYPVLNTEGKLTHVVCQWVDITDRKRAELALRESTREYESILSQLLAGVVVHARDTSIIYSNPEASRILGLTAEQISGKTYTDPAWRFLKPDSSTLKPEDYPVARVMATKKPLHDYTIGINSPERDATVWVNVNAIPILTEDDEVEKVIVNSVDITRLRETEQELREALDNTGRLKELSEAENVLLREDIRSSRHRSQIIGHSRAMKAVLAEAERVATTDSTVLLLGETGTGKELMAHSIHNMSPRKESRLVAFSCCAFPSGLVESELFGREKGAYTGANRQQIGRFEAANGGTLFLDEIGELPLETQAKLLRVLQERKVERLGGNKLIDVDARIIAATNRDLEKACDAGTFREDLFFRLNVFPITIPPLRDRPEDIEYLVQFFVDEFSRSMGKRVTKIPHSSMELLRRHTWPGNVRELRNVIERSMIQMDSGALSVETGIVRSGQAGHLQTLEAVERAHITGTLESARWRVRGRGGAADRLGLKPTTLEARMKKLRIVRPKD